MSLPLSAGHRHVLEVATSKIVCACDACALRFDNVIGRWKLIPRDSRPLAGFQMSDAQWESLLLPIGLAFFFTSTPTGRIVAIYPSPAGGTESLVPVTNWAGLVEENPALAEMQPDVEALLVNRLKEKREYYVATIDRCFELVGLIRLHWRGFSHGDLLLLRSQGADIRIVYSPMDCLKIAPTRSSKSAKRFLLCRPAINFSANDSRSG